MNIAVIGIGGVGGYFGGKLTRLLEEDRGLNIYFIARGQHLNEIKKNGLLLDSDDGRFVCKPTLATDDISELPLLDFCLICVKAYDLDNALTRLKPKIKDTTMILPLLNGVDIYERIRAVIRNGAVLPSCVYVGTHIEKPGRVTQRGGAGTIIFGRDPEGGQAPDTIFDMLNRANIKYKWTDDPYTEIWNKFVFIASFGLVTADFNKTMGEVLQSKELRKYAGDIMEEITAIAAKKQVCVDRTVIEDTFAKAKTFPAGAKTSLQRDFETEGKPDERDLFGGAIIRMGEQTGTGTPVTGMIFDSMQKKKPSN